MSNHEIPEASSKVWAAICASSSEGEHPHGTTQGWVADGIVQRLISCRIEADTEPRETTADRGLHFCIMFSNPAGEDQQIKPFKGDNHGCLRIE